MRRLPVGALLCACGVALSAAVSQNPPPIALPALDLVPAAARDMIRRASRDAEARPADADAAGTLGRVLHAWEQWEPAHNAYRRAQALAPRAFEWPYLDGVMLQRLARQAEAVAQLRQAVAINPAFAPARVKLAEALFEAGLLDDGERLAADLAKDPATAAIGHYVLGRVVAATGRHQAALEHLQRAVQLFPEWGAAYYALGLSYRALDRPEDARRALERHAQYGPLWPGIEDPVMAAVIAVRDDPRARLARGISLAGEGDLAGAIAAHEAALAADPGLTQAHANLISLYGRTQQWAQAEAHYRTLVALGDVGSAHYDYGVLLGLQQRWSEAAVAYRLAIAVNPLNAPAHNNLGEALERQGDFSAALEAYRQAVACQPEFRAARFNAGRLLLRAERTDEAIAELSRLADGRDVTAPRVLFTLALAFARAGRSDDARKWAAIAHQLAIDYGQSNVAAAIARDLGPVR